jgi:hypothetical protein
MALLNLPHPLTPPGSRIPSLSSTAAPMLAARLLVNGAYGRRSSIVRPPQFLLDPASAPGPHLGHARA